MKSERKTYRGLLSAFAVSLASLLPGCVPSAPPTITPPTTLLVANSMPGSVAGFRTPSSLDGNVAPTTDIKGASTALKMPRDMAVNALAQLLVCDQDANAILIYDDVANATGDTAPSRTVSGSKTMLNQPYTLAVDQARDLAYVLNYNKTEILRFPNCSDASFDGNVAPADTITSTSLTDPYAIRLDKADNLYVANFNGNNVLVFPKVSTLHGAVTPRILTNALFSAPVAVFVDASDHLFVLNGDFVLMVFSNASTLDGAVVPSTSFTVKNSQIPRGLAVDSKGTGYITDFDRNAIYVFDNLSTRSGLIDPDRTIQGATTGLASPVHLFMLEGTLPSLLVKAITP